MRISKIASLLVWLTVSISTAAQETKLTDHVNPFIGTSNYGTTNPGALCPNGMMSVTPFNVMGSELNRYDKDSSWWSTPYSSDNKYFTGFSHVNLSGVGCPEVGLALTMPTSGPLMVDHHVYGSEYTSEVAEPGYYGCDLMAHGIKPGSPALQAELPGKHQTRANT